MSLKTALFSYLGGITAVTDLVGTRVYPSVAPADAALPFIVYSIISSEHARHLGGASGFVRRRVQFDCYDATPDGVETVFQVISDALEAKTGDIGSEDLSVLSSGIESERDDYTAPTDGTEQSKFRRSVDFLIWHRL